MSSLNKNISVLITAFNTQDFIELCLDSIYNQDYFKNLNVNFEVIIGIDFCKKTLNKILDISYKYKNLSVFYFLENKGTYIVFNTLAQKAKYDYILRLDSDDIAYPNMISSIFNMDVNLYNIIRFGFRRYYNSNKISPVTKELACGCLFMKKSFFLENGGYLPWKCSADLEFINRTLKICKTGKINKDLFFYRRHSFSLTSHPKTKPGSETRKKYDSLITENYYKNISKIEITIETNFIKLNI